MFVLIKLSQIDFVNSSNNLNETTTFKFILIATQQTKDLRNKRVMQVKIKIDMNLYEIIYDHFICSSTNERLKKQTFEVLLTENQ